MKKFRKQQKDKDRQAEISEKRCEAAEDYNLRSPESISQSALPLTVNFNFKKGKNMARKRISRQVASAKRKINKLTEENETLKKTVSRLYKRSTRKSKYSSASSVPVRPPVEEQQSADALTPRKRTDKEIRDSGASPSTLPKPVRRKLLEANLLSDEIKISASKNKRRSHFIRKVVSGRITKKYRATRLIASMTNLDRKKLSLNNTKRLSTPLKKRSTNIIIQLTSKVASFLSRDDNSRMMPGKKDGRGQIQNRVLNDYMKNLHLKFLAENPEIKVSTGTFSKLRPSSIRLCNFLLKRYMSYKTPEFCLEMQMFAELQSHYHHQPGQFHQKARRQGSN